MITMSMKASVLLSQALLASTLPNTIDYAETACMLSTVYHEARGESLAGKQAVASVVLNRVNSSKFPDTICGVVQQSNQFAFVTSTGSNLVTAKNRIEERTLNESIAITLDAMYGRLKDNTKGSLFYVNISKLKSSPKWLKGSKVLAKIGNHTFLKLRK